LRLGRLRLAAWLRLSVLRRAVLTLAIGVVALNFLVQLVREILELLAGAAEGFGLVAEVGAPCWFELITPETAACEAFYTRLLGSKPFEHKPGRHAFYDVSGFRFLLFIPGCMGSRKAEHCGGPQHFAFRIGNQLVPDASVEEITRHRSKSTLG
jgi:hypothetical protein